ncbi:MAG: hypothetical protein JOZ27_06960 [Caulobacteraceae bacterium]|nr:hypothetical protein [Caulobacteraceae bacterium]
MTDPSPEAQLAGFLARFAPEVEATATRAIEILRERLPGAFVLVYDNYNALAVGFGPNARTSEAVFSIAVFPRRPSLCFIQGASLADPDGLLRGGGNQVRNVILDTPEVLDDPRVVALMDAALAASPNPIPSAPPGPLIIKSISAKQRPRRPG